MGGKSSYTKDIADKICEELARGKSLVRICDEINVSYSTVMKWLTDFPDFSDNYTRAREEQAEYLADEIIHLIDQEPAKSLNKAGHEVIDNGWVTNQRNRIDARKWIASKLLPKKYGDKQHIELNGTLGLSDLTPEQLASQLTEAAAGAGIAIVNAGGGEKKDGE